MAALTLLAAISTTEQRRDWRVDEQIRELELRVDDVTRRLVELEAEVLHFGNVSLDLDDDYLDVEERLEKPEGRALVSCCAVGLTSATSLSNATECMFPVCHSLH